MSEPTGTSEILAEGRFLRLKRCGGWEYVERTNATGVVMIVAMTEAGGVLLVEQFRPPVNKRVIELPAGLVGDTSDAAESLEFAARRELLEETGYEPAVMTQVAEGPPSPGDSSEIVTIYVASGCRRISAGGGDEHEDIIVHEVPLTNANAWLGDRIREGLLIDPLVWSGLHLALRGGSSARSGGS